MDAWLRDKLDALPDEPGIYVFRDRRGSPIYVGKAKSLRSRVRSYFQQGSSDGRYFIALLDRVLGDIETTVIESEKEAALLENAFIKEHQPTYNVRLCDDKDFLHLKIDLDDEWPRLQLVRRPRLSERSRQVKLFGPYHSARSARRTMLLASRFFHLRTCKDSALRKRSRPCLLYQMGRCPGPCVYDIDREAYIEQVQHAALFLAGRPAELLHQLEEKMRRAAEELAYERAALYRDQIQSVEATLANQNVVTLTDVDEDVFGLCRDEDQVLVVVLKVRGGRISAREDFHWKGRDIHADEGDLLSSVLAQYYEPDIPLPQFVLLPHPLEDADVLSELLTERRGAKVSLHWPQRGRRKRLVQVAQDNARRAVLQRGRAEKDIETTLAQLGRRLGMSHPPSTIECIDVAHRGSGKAVAAIARLREGKPDRTGTRSFTVKAARAGDDYGSMYEVLSRRFRRARQGEKGWELPDLLVVDGGRGQLGVAEAALRDAEMPSDALALVGLAKERPARRSVEGEVRKNATEERVYVPGRVNPLSIRGTSPLLLLCRARDEAHRLAGKLLAKRDKAKALDSPLDKVPGVGSKIRNRLLETLGSIKAVKGASVEELEKVPGIGPSLAARIHQHFHPQ